jgi:hypothetical protein
MRALDFVRPAFCNAGPVILGYTLCEAREIISLFIKSLELQSSVFLFECSAGMFEKWELGTEKKRVVVPTRQATYADGIESLE